MLIPLAVVPHSTALSQLASGLQRYVHTAIGSGLPCQGAEFYRIKGFAHVAAAGAGNMLAYALLDGDGAAALLTQEFKTAANRLFNLFYIHRLEFKHSGAAEDGVINVEIGILGGGSDQSNLTVLNKLQQGLLLTLIEILNLIQIQQDAVHTRKGVQFLHHCLDIRCGCGGAVELMQAHIRLLGNDASHRGLAHAGGTVKDQIGDTTGLHNIAQSLALAQDVLLTHHLAERCGANAVGKRFIHSVSLP